MDFAKIAPYLQDPLVLIGFALFLGFSLTRGILKAGIIPQLTAGLGYRVLQRILLYGFIIALALIGLGFGLKYRELSHAEQASAVNLLDQELQGNLRVLEALRANTETIVRAAATVSKALRTPGIAILPAIFPIENTDPKQELPGSVERADRALRDAKARGLLDDVDERRKFGEAGQAIAGVISRTEPTIRSLADAANQRYVIAAAVWQSQLPVLRRIDIIDVTLFQQSYQRLLEARANYNVIVARAQDFLDATRNFFSPESGPVTKQKLASVLNAERLFCELVSRFLPDLIDDIVKVQELDKRVHERV